MDFCQRSTEPTATRVDHLALHLTCQNLSDVCPSSRSIPTTTDFLFTTAQSCDPLVRAPMVSGDMASSIRSQPACWARRWPRPSSPGRRMSEAPASGRSEPHSPNRALSEKRPRGSTPPMYIRDPEVPLLRSFSSSRTRKAEVQSPVRQRYSETRTMTEPKFLTTKEVADRYRGTISIGTLKNWRSLRIGPSFVKLGKTILYPVEHLDRWDQENFVTCHAPKGGRPTGRERS